MLNKPLRSADIEARSVLLLRESSEVLLGMLDLGKVSLQARELGEYGVRLCVGAGCLQGAEEDGFDCVGGEDVEF